MSAMGSTTPTEVPIPVMYLVLIKYMYIRDNQAKTLKALCHDIRAICDITTPTRQPLIENSVRNFNLVDVVMSRVTLIY